MKETEYATVTKDDIEVLRDVDGMRRVEFWTDGATIRLGKDVTDPNKCVRVPLENVNEAIDNIRYFDGSASKFRLADEIGTTDTYIVHDNVRPEVIHNGETVLKLGSDGWPLYTAKTKALEERDEFEAEEHARQFVNSVKELALADKININRRGTTDKVHISVTKEKFYNVQIDLIDKLREKSFVCDGPHVSWDRDENGMNYSFTVNTRKMLEELKDD